MRLFRVLILLSVARAAFIRQVPCNGHPQLCSRSYSNISFVGSHDASFVGVIPSDNQDIFVTAQLNAGIRFLQAQVHKSLNPLKPQALELCHTSCVLRDSGSLQSFLSTVKTWLDQNPNEVLTLLLTNSDNVDVSSFGSAFSASGITRYTFAPSKNAVPLQLSSWPTLQDLISAGTRLVVFLDYGAKPAKVPYILDEFSYYFEDAFDTTDLNFPNCSVDRPPGASPKGRMYITNHYLDTAVGSIDVPDKGNAAKVNAATGVGSIGAQAATCSALYGRNPNCVLVDFEDKGQVFAAQNALNGLS